MKITGMSLAAIIYIGGSVGPDGAVTGLVAVQVILLLLGFHWIWNTIDWIERKLTPADPSAPEPEKSK